MSDSLINHPDLWRHALPVPGAESHKYTRGHCVVAGGPVESTGAARLAALSALRAGAGLVSVACDGAALPVYASALTAVMTRRADTPLDYVKLVQDARVTALVAGPGLGLSVDAAARIAAALETQKPCVLDADALTLLSEQSSLQSFLHAQCVLTPHEGEFAKLFRIKGTREERARVAAEKAGCIVVLKGHDTLIATPDGRMAVNKNASPWLATAGSGDVLAGIIAGLLAQGMNAFDAACAGVWVHADAAKRLGPGLIAEDLPHMLPAVWSGLV